jgi:type VI protein secretion system component VasK
MGFGQALTQNWIQRTQKTTRKLKQDAKKTTLHRMAKVHNFLEMWQGSQNLHATQKEARAQYKQMTAIGYISDTEEIVKAS